jgi:hypothetical protein
LAWTEFEPLGELLHCGSFSRTIESARPAAQNSRQQATKGDRRS